MHAPDSRGLLDAARVGLEHLRAEDPGLFDLLSREYRRQNEVLAMIAASSIADPSVLACESTPTANVTVEGYPGARLHAGSAVVDEIETLAVARARRLFGATYANVQPHSGSSANAIVLFSQLEPGDTILGLSLEAGGHFTHGAPESVSGKVFRAFGYGVDAAGRIDLAEVRALAERHRPRLIVCGASCYPRRMDWEGFRRVADAVGALLLADISHLAGLVAAGEHPSPVDHAHFTTTSTYKQLNGPRGGLILMGRDATDERIRRLQEGVFPLVQGTPNLATIAAKARAFDLAAGADFRATARRIVADARAMAEEFRVRGHRVVTGGTDNHIVLLDVAARGLTGLVAERALERVGIVVNKNRLPGDLLPPMVASGLRLGTNNLAVRGMGPEHMPACVALIDRVLEAVVVRGLTEFDLPDAVAAEVGERVRALCRAHPIPRYPLGTAAPRAAVSALAAGR